MQNLKFGQSFRWTAVAARFQIKFCKWYGYFCKWYRKFIVFGNFKMFKNAEFKIWAELPQDCNDRPISDLSSM